MIAPNWATNPMKHRNKQKRIEILQLKTMTFWTRSSAYLFPRRVQQDDWRNRKTPIPSNKILYCWLGDVVLNRTVAVSDWRFDNLCGSQVNGIKLVDGIKLWLLTWLVTKLFLTWLQNSRKWRKGSGYVETE